MSGSGKAGPGEASPGYPLPGAREGGRGTLYIGQRMERKCVVYKDGKILDPSRSLKVWNHSPDGFEWGYSGSGPAQLALALLLEEGCTDAQAINLHQEFKRALIANLERDNWRFTGEFVRAWIATRTNHASADPLDREHLPG